MLACLASPTEPQFEELFLGAGRGRGRTSEKGDGRRGNPKDADGQTMECDICHSAQHCRRECPQGDGRCRGSSILFAQAESDTQYVDWGALLAEPADTPVPLSMSWSSQ
eukprot:6140561-Pyramimonas_sp.AAC.1